MKRTFFLGLDLGKRHDYTALVVVERLETAGELDPVTYQHRKIVGQRVRYVKRIQLGTEYVEIVARVKQVMESPSMQGGRHLVVDATGVGGAVVGLLRGARLGCQVWPVSITGGDADGFADGLYRAPKRDLVVGLQLMLEQRTLQFAEGLPEREALVKEMGDMRVKLTSSGREQYEAGSSGQHDDIVSALSLACWAMRKTFDGPGIGWKGKRVV
jgi:hypothetical protein